MRKTLIFLLLAGAAVPAVAAADPPEGDGNWAARRQAREQSRSEAAARPDRPHFSGFSRPEGDSDGERPRPVLHVERGNGGSDDGERPRPVLHVERGNGGDGGPAAVQDDSAAHRGHQSIAGWRVVRQANQGSDGPAIRTSGGDSGSQDSVRNWHGTETRQHIVRPQIVEQGDVGAPAGSLRQFDRPLPRVMRTRTPVVSQVPREGTQPPAPTERLSQRHRETAQWSGNWRNDRRYDWHDWRRHHRSRFHLGFYFDPFGWSYRPYSIGWRLWPSYYSSRYWIMDPWDYRLPYAPPGYRWIRYWDDALLVDTFTGEVVDVIHNFFW